MSFKARFRVDGLPKGQPRPRAFVRNGHARIFNPGDAENWKGNVVLAGFEHRPESPLTGAVRVWIAVYLPRPKRLMRERDPTGCVACIAKPDADNLAKAVLDALTHDGWWQDDSQVMDLRVVKQYHAKGDRPGAFIDIREVEEQESAGDSEPTLYAGAQP